MLPVSVVFFVFCHHHFKTLTQIWNTFYLSSLCGFPLTESVTFASCLLGNLNETSASASLPVLSFPSPVLAPSPSPFLALALAPSPFLVPSLCLSPAPFLARGLAPAPCPSLSTSSLSPSLPPVSEKICHTSQTSITKLTSSGHIQRT